MSEYQYYEFQAVDRPLTEAEMRELRARSTRATITPTRFVNFYTWGDLKGNPSAWMEKYFDAFLYFANWGTHQLMLRFPRRALDAETAGRYCSGESARARGTRDFVILEFLSDDEPDDAADDGTGWLSSLIPLRADIASGDRRALYLAWLLCAQQWELDDEATEPPVPPGLGEFTAPLAAFAEFLRIDGDLVAAAAERSAEGDAAPSHEEVERWITTLPETEKERLLVRVATGEEDHPRAEILRRFRQTRRRAPERRVEPRTVAELLEAAEHRARERRRKQAERAARERARREREEAAARERHLDELATREAEAWRRVDSLVAARRPAAYDEAVQLLADLHELGVRDGRGAEVAARIQALRDEHARKSSFLERLRKAGLDG